MAELLAASLGVGGVIVIGIGLAIIGAGLLALRASGTSGATMGIPRRSRPLMAMMWINVTIQAVAWP